jgi:hypothetical protein
MVESCEPSDYPCFGKIPSEKIKEKANLLAEWIWGNKADMPRDRLSVSNSCIMDIIELVERRRVYFHVFHKVDMSEWNEIALYCFWLVKLQPFFEIALPNAKSRQANEINALIAVRILINTVKKIRKNKGKKSIEQLNIGNLIHALRYRDISKEAVMAIFENLINA